MKVSGYLLAVAAAASTVTALTPAEWRGQSIYQVLTDRFARTDGSTTATCNVGDYAYCGGSWRGIINHLDYIQGMGFTAIWISPIVKNAAGGFHGYWAQDIYSVNSNFGTEQDLIDLSAALHAKGMYLMVDVVANHMGYNGCGDCVDYSIFNPFNTKSDYHDFCLINYNDVNSIKTCWMGDNTVSLPDLRTEDSAVASVLNSWVKDLVTKYSIDGLRLDSAQQVNNDFLQPFEANAGVYMVGEVFNGDPSYTCPYQGRLSGVLNFPAYYWINQAFQTTSGSISNLVNGINTMKTTCSDTTLLGSFMENHDVVRFPSVTSDLSLTKNAIAFTMLADGIPIVYYGQEQQFKGGNDPNNREALWLSGYPTTSTLYQFIASVNQIRNQAVYKSSSYVTYKAYPVYSDGSVIAMRKGATGYQIIGVFNNQGAGGGSYTLTLSSSATGFTASQSLVEVLSCTAYTTDSSGNINVAMASGLPRVFYPAAQAAGSGICPNLILVPASSTLITTTKPATSTSTSSTTCPTSVAVTFNELVTTTYGTNVKIVGNNAALGNWAPASGVALLASQYTTANPLWYVTLNLAAGTTVVYKYVKVDSAGTVTWESDPNRTVTVPACASATTVSNSWQ